MVCCVVCVVRVCLFWFVVGFEHSLVVLQFVYGLVKRLRNSVSVIGSHQWDLQSVAKLVTHSF